MADGEKQERLVMRGGVRFKGQMYHFSGMSRHVGKVVLVDALPSAGEKNLVGRIGDKHVELVPLPGSKQNCKCIPFQ